MTPNSIRTTLLITVTLITFGCTKSNKHSENDSTNNATPVATHSSLITLFDGKTTNGWHRYNSKDPVKNWVVDDGALVCLGTANDAHGGDLVTDSLFDNFELNWDWKISPAGNSGVMYHVVESNQHAAPYETGPEYQMIDDIGFPEKLEDWQKTGADYAMHTSNGNGVAKPIGEWNHSSIIVNNSHVEHWLNGEKIVEFETWTPEWNKLKETGKWKDYADYGVAKSGAIAFQDHGQKAYFKNILLKKL